MVHPNSLKNLKKTAGPGRPKITPEERFIKRAIREYMKEYLENGEAVKDFERVRAKKPEVALSEAMDRVYGRVKEPGGSEQNILVLIPAFVQILTGKTPPQEPQLIENSEGSD